MIIHDRHLGWLAHACDVDAALEQALNDVVSGRVGVRARQDGAHLRRATGRPRDARQDLQQRQQCARLARPGRAL